MDEQKKLIEEESASVPAIKQEKPIDVSDEALISEEELEKIAPVQDVKALKTKTYNKKVTFTTLFIVFNVMVILLTAVMEFTGETQPVPLSYVWNTFLDNWFYAVCALGMALLSLICQAAIRYNLLKSTLKKGKPLLSFNSTVLCRYYDSITPLGSGGQPFEIYYLRKKGVPVGIASGVPIVSYALGRFAFALVVSVTLILYGFGHTSTFLMVLCILGLLVNIFIPIAVFTFTIMPKVGSAVARFVAVTAKKLHLVKDPDIFTHKLTDQFIEYADCIKFFLKQSKIRLLIGFIFAVASHVALYSIPYFCIRMSGNVDVSWVEMFSLCVICITSVVLLPTPGNAGGAEFSFRAIFERYLTGGILFWGMLSWRLLSYYLFIFIGLIAIISQQISKLVSGDKKPAANTENENLYTPLPNHNGTVHTDDSGAQTVIEVETTLETVHTAVIPDLPPVEADAAETVLEAVVDYEVKRTAETPPESKSAQNVIVKPIIDFNKDDDKKS